MSIGGIGSTSSFYQDDQNYWNQQQAYDSQQSASNSLINAIANAETSKAKGLASIANQTALNRTNSQLTALIQQVLDGGTSSSSSSSGSSSSSSSTSSASTTVQPASGIGTVPVTTTTTLASLGILPGGTLTFGDGGSSPTTYTSTGSDTIGDVINAINNGSAFLTASINSSGHLTVTARDTKKSVVISGSGTDATAIGFGNNNNTFQPIQPTKSATSSSASSTSSTSSTSTSSTSSSTSSTSSNKSSAVPSAREEMASSAASLLSDSGVSGTLVNMLA